VLGLSLACAYAKVGNLIGPMFAASLEVGGGGYDRHRYESVRSGWLWRFGPIMLSPLSKIIRATSPY
jgi:hypothetical protein